MTSLPLISPIIECGGRAGRAEQAGRNVSVTSTKTPPEKASTTGSADRTPADVAERVWARLTAIDTRFLDILSRVSIPLLRVSLGIVFIWFGILKIAGETPVTELVANTVYWVDPDWFVPVLGAFEAVVGIGLLLGRAMRIILFLFVLQMAGTFLVLVLQPDVAFQGGNPLLLTTEGEFVIKNLVLLSAGLVLGSHLRRIRPWFGTGEQARLENEAPA
ncbi:MAG: DoxX family membrane protein [Actinobacteria bacterium]|nr:DoxX family membrane protein [Actinomycetota bacterium]